VTGGLFLAKHLYTFIDPPNEKHLAEACALLAAGGVLAYPTDLNWAIGCDAANVKALDRIRRLKPSHPKDQPFSLLCDDIAMASTIGTIDQPAYRMLRRIFPGPYTVLLPRHRSLPRQIKDKRRIVGIRIPEAPLIRALIARYGHPIATTSVPSVPVPQPVGEEAPKFGYQVAEHFGHGLDLILDLGDEMPGTESTIIDMSEGEPQIIRVGAGDPAIFGVRMQPGEQEFQP